MDETYIKVNGVWKYLYRSVDKQGKTVDFLLTAKRDMTAAKRFFDKAMVANGNPDKAAIDEIYVGRDVSIVVRHQIPQQHR
ncbi:DDE-type integrase/transposase/recombinase [Massilia eurypsychrophila]|uniref:DDE-type integrase/transposase/recombinase n=1 Tax=Massilia eurypsychrophila TaxID=1485217 RepID=UPI00351D51E3